MFSRILYICLSVCLYPINVKTTEPTGPILCVESHVTQRKGYEWLKVFYFVKILKMREKFWNPQIFCLFLYSTKRKCAQIKPQLKVEIEVGHEAPLKSKFFKFHKNLMLLNTTFCNSEYPQTFLGSCHAPHKSWSWSVQTDRQAKYIYIYIYSCPPKILIFRFY